MTVAWARLGRTFSLKPALNMVTAVVVRWMASVSYLPASTADTAPERSHRFDRIIWTGSSRFGKRIVVDTPCKGR